MKFTPLGAKGYTAWIDNRDGWLVGGVLEIPGFPTLKATCGTKGEADLLEMVEMEINKYLKLCDKLGWQSVKRDSAASGIHHLSASHDSDAVRDAVHALKTLANECAGLVGAEAAQRLAIAIVASRIKPQGIEHG